MSLKISLYVKAFILPKIKNFLLDNNVVIHSDSLEGIMLEHFKILKSGGVVFITDDELSQSEPSFNIDGNQLNIYYIGNLMENFKMSQMVLKKSI